MKSIYCTVLSQARLPQAMALQHSIARHSPDALFYFFCLDQSAAEFLKAQVLNNVRVFGHGEFAPPELQALQPSLKVVEYCAVCKPVVLTHAMADTPDVDWIVWIDSDMFAFGDVDTALAAAPAASVLLTPHRFFLPEFVAFEPVVGRFNAGYVAFRNSEQGRAALLWWKERCFESCAIVPTDDLFGDQKYLNRIPEMFSDVAEAPVGVNCAPWNIFGLSVELSGSEIRVSGEPLLLYHYQGLRMIRPWIFDLYGSKLALAADVRKLIYRPYLAELARQLRVLGARMGANVGGVDERFTGAGWIRRLALQFLRSRNVVVRFSQRTQG